MKRLVLGLIALLAAGPAFAQTSVSGDWDVTIVGPQGPNTVRVTFKQEADKVSGLMKSPNGELPFSGGSMAGDVLKWAFTVNFQGQPLEIRLDGKVAGDAIDGKVDFGGFIDGTWTAKRVDAAAAAASTTTSTTTTSATSTTTTTKAGGLSGEWDVVTKTPGGDIPSTAKLVDDGGKITGTLASQMGEGAVTGKVEGKVVTLSLVAQTPQGDLTVVMTGEIDGDSIINGKAEITGIGQMEFTAKKKP